MRTNELSVNFMKRGSAVVVGSKDESDARKKVKAKKEFKKFKMHIDGIQEISLVDNYEVKLKKECFKLRDLLNSKLNAKILGPVNAPIYRIKKKYRNRLLIRSKKTLKIQQNQALTA